MFRLHLELCACCHLNGSNSIAQFSQPRSEKVFSLALFPLAHTPKIGPTAGERTRAGQDLCRPLIWRLVQAPYKTRRRVSDALCVQVHYGAHVFQSHIFGLLYRVPTLDSPPEFLPEPLLDCRSERRFNGAGETIQNSMILQDYPVSSRCSLQ